MNGRATLHVVISPDQSLGSLSEREGESPPGEREALSLAAELAAGWLNVDHLAARRIARALHLRVAGTLGVLLAAKRRGVIPLLRPPLDRLLEKSFFLSPPLYAELLAVAGEESP